PGMTLRIPYRAIRQFCDAEVDAWTSLAPHSYGPNHATAGTGRVRPSETSTARMWPWWRIPLSPRRLRLNQ
ncbi:MAG TPA: hypothetical protein VII33_08905, partial [Nakamurella sp.]